MKILASTTNQGKLREISRIMEHAGILIVSPKEIDIRVDVVEDGLTFVENATKKAKQWCEASNLPCLADDSGLCVDALDGRPGVMSARFAGEKATDIQNYELLLELMHGQANRNARFVCAAVLAMPGGELIVTQGHYSGIIIDKPIGSGGFGYDPVFYDPLLNKTVAQMDPDEKNELSHRAQALRALRQRLSELGYLKGV